MTVAHRVTGGVGVPVAGVVVMVSFAVIALGDPDVAIPPLAVVISAAMVSSVVIVVATALEFRDQRPFPVRTLLWRVGLLLLTFVFGSLLWVSRDPDRLLPSEPGAESERRPDAGNQPGGRTESEDPTVAAIQQWTALVMGLLAAVLVAWLVWYYLRQRQPRSAASDPETPVGAEAGRLDLQEDERRRAVREGLLRGRGALLREDDPRIGVVRAYLAFERHLGGHGVVRRPAETQREFATRVLAVGGLSHPDRARPLVELFNVARFSDLPVTPADARAAREHIDAMVGD